MEILERLIEGEYVYMLYFLNGTEQYFIQQALDKIIPAESEQTIIFSANDTSIGTIIEEVCSDDLFGGAKDIILKDMQDIDIKAYIEPLTVPILESMANASNNLIILFEREDKLSKTQEKLFKDIFNVSKRINVQKQDTNAVIRQVTKYLDNIPHSLTRQDIEALVTRYKNDMQLIFDDIDQAILRIGTESTELTAKHFNLENTDFLEEQVFDLITRIDAKDVKASLDMLDNLFLHQQNVFGLVALLFKNYKEMYQIQSLKAHGYRFNQIAKRLNIHEYRCKKLAQSSQNIPLESYDYILSLFIDVDAQLKSSIDPQQTMHTLFLKLFV